MPTAILGIGIPGSGKTTYLKKLADQYGAVYVCPDETRQALSGNAGNQAVNRQVWDMARYSIGHALYNCNDIVLDATNAKVSERRSIVQHCRQHASMVIGVWFTTPLATCLERNAARDRIVPARVIMRMYKQLLLTPPSQDDGFDLILKHKQL